MGGEHPFPEERTWGFTRHNPYYGVYPTKRRSVYLMQQRLKRHPFLALFDGADPNVSTAERLITTTPTQALYLMNAPFIHDNAKALAERVWPGARDSEGLVSRAHDVILGRNPTDDELESGVNFLHAYVSRLDDAGSGESMEARRRAALAAYVRTLFVRNEFLYID